MTSVSNTPPSEHGTVGLGRLGRPEGRGISDPTVVLRLSKHEASRLESSPGRRRSLFIKSDSDLSRALSSPGVAGIVWELSRHVAPQSRAVPSIVLDAAQHLPLLLCVEPSAPRASDILRLMAAAPDVRVSFCGSHDLRHEIECLCANPADRSAEQSIINAIGPHILPFAVDIVTVAAVSSKRRTTVGTWSKLCGCSPGTLRYRLAAVRAPEPRALLGRFTAAHVAWRRGPLGWAAKRTARETGYSGTVALDHFVRRHASTSLRDMADPDCFWRLLELLVDCLRPHRPN